MKLRSNPANTFSGNRLLVSLPATVISGCESVMLQSSEVLCRPGRRLRHVYFPVEGFISLITRLDSGEQLEVGIIGNEGMFDVSLLLGAPMVTQIAVVQGAGTALRMRVDLFTSLCSEYPRLRQTLQLYACVLLQQFAISAVCSHYHDTDQRLARWLLLTHDRAHTSQLHLTHAFMASMLGVRRVGITVAAHALQKRGLIEYRRGQIVILDLPALKLASCSCYRQANDVHARTMKYLPGK